MERDGLWRLFFATGLPEVYLAIRRARQKEVAPKAKTAFLPRDDRRRPV